MMKQLLALESKYCSWGDTVHYAKQLNIFREADGIYLYDTQGRGISGFADVVFRGQFWL